MLPSVGKPFSASGWFFELKYDGFRMIAGKEAGRPRLRYRRGSDATDQFPEVAADVAALPAADIVLDGELVVFDDQGRPSFDRLQTRFVRRRAHDIESAAAADPATLVVFDVLALGDLDLRPMKLRDRKRVLSDLGIPRSPHVLVPDHVETEGEALYHHPLDTTICASGLMARSGGRSPRRP